MDGESNCSRTEDVPKVSHSMGQPTKLFGLVVSNGDLDKFKRVYRKSISMTIVLRYVFLFRSEVMTRASTGVPRT